MVYLTALPLANKKLSHSLISQSECENYFACVRNLGKFFIRIANQVHVAYFVLGRCYIFSKKLLVA